MARLGRGTRGVLAAGLALAALPWFLPAGLARSLAPEWGMALSLAAFVVAGLAAASPHPSWPRWRRGICHALLLVVPPVVALSLAPGLTTFCPPLPAAFATFAPWAPLPPALLGAALGAVGRPGLRPAWGRLGWFLLASAAFTGLQVYLGPRIAPSHPATGKLAFHFSSGGWDTSAQSLGSSALTVAAALLLMAAAAARARRARAAAALSLALGTLAWATLGDAWGGGVGIVFRREFQPLASWPAENPEVLVLAARGAKIWTSENRRLEAGRLAARAGALAREHRGRLGLDAGPPLRIFLLTDKLEQPFWTGVDKVDFVKPWQKALYLSWLMPGTQHLSHELAHAVLGSVGPAPFGVPLNPTVVEGAAVALAEFMDEEEGQWRHVAYAPALAEGPTEILGGVSFWTGNFQTSYLRAGGLIGYLIKSRGPGAFLKFYRHSSWVDAFGLSAADALREWGLYLEGLEVPDRVRRQSAALYARPPAYLDACVVPWNIHVREARARPEQLSLLVAEAGSDTPRARLPGGDDLRTALAWEASFSGGEWLDRESLLAWMGESAYVGAALRAGRAHRDEDGAAALWWLGEAMARTDAPDWRFVLLAREADVDPGRAAAALEELRALEVPLPQKLALRWRAEWLALETEAPWWQAHNLKPGDTECATASADSLEDPALVGLFAVSCGPAEATTETDSLLLSLPEPERRWLLQRLQAFAVEDLEPDHDPALALQRLATIGRVDPEWAKSPALGRIRLLAEALLEVR